MKKLIAILLVVLVAGFVFAEDPTATLTLTSEVSGRLVHGFSSIEIDAEDINFGKITSELDSGALNETYNEYTSGQEGDFIDLEGSGGAVGYYYFATNSNTSGYYVDFTVNPFSSIEDGVTFTVPYTLNYKSLRMSNNISVNSVETIALEGALGGTIVPKTLRVISTTGNTNSPRYGGLSLDIEIAGNDNLAFGLPEGDYEATVVASLTTN